MGLFAPPSQFRIEARKIGVTGRHVAKAIDVRARRHQRAFAVVRRRCLKIDPDRAQAEATRVPSPFSSARIGHGPVAKRASIRTAFAHQ